MSDSVWPHGLQPARLPSPWDSSGKSTRGGCHFLLQGTLSTQGSNLGLLHCRLILYYWAPGKPSNIYFLFLRVLSRTSNTIFNSSDLEWVCVLLCQNSAGINGCLKKSHCLSTTNSCTLFNSQKMCWEKLKMKNFSISLELWIYGIHLSFLI